MHHIGMTDQDFMKVAFAEAVAAGKRGECPVGAVLVKDGRVIVRAGNEELALMDPTAHAEMLCLRRAGALLGHHLFPGCTMYTSLWPCPMCDGAMLQARISRVVSGARAFRWVLEDSFNPGNLVRIGPIMEEECRALFLDWARQNNRLEILLKEGLV
jgi:tRNA(adenine34) deaminase